MGTPRRERGQNDPVARFRHLQLDGAAREAVTALFHELQVHQEELSAQNQQLIETQSALEESRDRYVDLYDFAPIGFLTMDTAGIVLEMNLTAASMLGKERCKIVGLPFNAFVAAPDKVKFADHLRHCRQVDLTRTTVELMLTVGNSALSAQLITRPQGIDNARILLTAIVDITERRGLEEQNRIAEEAREKLTRDREIARARADAKDHFLATLSHELRTPLTPIVATMSNDRLISLAPEPLRTALHTVRRNLDLEVRLIDDLLDVTRISRDRLVLTHERVDLHRVVPDVVDMVRGEIQQRGVRVIMNMDAPTHSVVGDPTRLRQVFWNLMGNALKFTRVGGSITVTSVELSGVVQVTVSDSGEGMDSDVVTAINDNTQGSRALPIQSSTGLGLGLAICRGVVSAHGGTLKAVSAGKERGSTFVVRIPISAHLEEWDRPRPASDVAPDHASPRLRILLVEDHQDSADTLSPLLAFHGFDVTVARTVQDALSTAEQGVDFVISDIRLPDGTGLDLMRKLQSREGVRGIAISGFGTEQDQRRSREAGFGMHLTKPVDFNRLLEAIDQVSGNGGNTA